MLKFNANITQLYLEHGFLDRFAAAAADGFKGVEFRSPYSERKDVIAEKLAESGMAMVLFNFPMGNWDAGDRGLGCLPGRQSEFREGVDLAIEYAQALGCGQLNCVAGLVPAGYGYEELEAVLVGNLQYASEKLRAAGIRLLLEPQNNRDLPGCLVSSTKLFERIFDKVKSDNLYLQYDFYHMQIMQGDLVATFEAHQRRIAHVQIANNPGRHEPDIGEIDYSFIFSELERLGYQGWIGCEYVPRTTTSAGLGWLSAWQSRQN